MKAIIKAKTAAEELGISRQRMNILLNTGRFPNAWQDGKTWLIPRADIDKYIAGKSKKDVE